MARFLLRSHALTYDSILWKCLVLEEGSNHTIVPGLDEPYVSLQED